MPTESPTSGSSPSPRSFAKVSAVAEPRLGGGFVASVMFHGALVAAFFFLRPGALPPAPPVYRVELFAAPPGERQAGVVQDQPQPTPPPETKPVVKQPPPKPVATKLAPKPTPKKAVAPIKQATPLPP